MAAERKASNSKPPRVDLHTHILPEELPDWASKFGEGPWIRIEHHEKHKAKLYKGKNFFREVNENCYRAAARITDCDRLGIQLQVLSTVPVMFSYFAKPEQTLEIHRYLNDHMSKVVKENPLRFAGLAALPMQDVDMAVGELKRAINELGLVGAEIGSHCNERQLSDSYYDPLWAEAEKLGAAIFVHPWDMPGMKTHKYWLPWLCGMPYESTVAVCSMVFGGVFEKFPKLRVCFSHGGGMFCFTVGRVDGGHAVKPQVCAVDCKANPKSFLGQFWVDSLVMDPDSLKMVVDRVTNRKVVVGSDYPFALGEEEPGKMVEEMNEFSEITKQQILWKNALDFLGLADKAVEYGFEKKEEPLKMDEGGSISCPWCNHKMEDPEIWIDHKTWCKNKK